MFKQHIKLGEVFGIPVGMNRSFPLIVGLLALLQGFSAMRYGPLAALASVTEFVVLYAFLALSIVAHEFGHALVGRKWFGAHCEHITMHALGGVAMMEIPNSPKGEFWVGLAGPLVSLALAILLMPFVWLTHSGMLYTVMSLNFLVFLFNLVPAFPLDGGRMFRAVLATKIGHRSATRLAIRVSRGLVGLGVVLGLIYSLWMLLLVGAFVLLLGYAEERNLEEDYR